MNTEREIIMPLLLILALILVMIDKAESADLILFGGLFAYDDSYSGTSPDYAGLSPNGYYGLKIRHEYDDTLAVSVGIKHESSTAYREIGRGFNGIFIEGEFTFTSW